MATSAYTKRMHAMEFAIASSSEADSPQDIVRRAQIYTDWLTGKLDLNLRYDTDEASTTTDAANVLPMKPKGSQH